MKIYLRNIWEGMSQSLWLMPAVAISFATLAAFLMLRLESHVGEGWQDLPFLYRSGTDASLAIVSTIVGSLMTVAGVTFSITIVSLTLASSQFGPRLLRNFLQSGPSQITLGALMGSFVYGILIMPGIDEGWTSGQAHPSVTLMILLACMCVCVIVYYIHHVATSIQADSLVASVYGELESRIKRLPEITDCPLACPVPDSRDATNTYCSKRSGYVTALSVVELVEWTEKHGLQICFRVRAGQFIARGEIVADVFGDLDSDKLSSKFDETIFIGDKRTPEQDLEFLIDQLVEVALRAISPGINDPNTAIVCIDYLSAAFCQLSQRELPQSHLVDPEGVLRVFVPQTDFSGLVNAGFDQLRQTGRDYPEIVIRLVESLVRIRKTLDSGDERGEVLQRQFEQLAASRSGCSANSKKDQSDLQEAMAVFEKLT